MGVGMVGVVKNSNAADYYSLYCKENKSYSFLYLLMKSTYSFFNKTFAWIIIKKRILLFIFCLLVVISLHGLALSSKIVAIEPALYKNIAYDLKVTPENRYGYAWVLRGAVLVKTANSDSSIPEENKAISLSSKTLENTMKRELHLIPVKTILELGFYIVLLWYAFWGSSWLKSKLHIEKKNFFLTLCFSAMVWMIFWIVAYFPYGVFGYGEPWHSDAIGPYALSYESSPFLVFAGSVLTISYCYFINILTGYPLMIGTIMDYKLQYLPSIRDHILYNMWFLGLLVFGMGGLIYAYIKESLLNWTTREKMILILIIVATILTLVCFKPWISPALPETVRAKLSAYDRSYEIACDKFLSDMNLYEKKKKWPRTLPDAVNRAILSLSKEDKEIVRDTPFGDLILFHLNWGMDIRNDFGLWLGNKELLRACGSEKMHPDDASMIIIISAWKKLNEEYKAGKVRTDEGLKQHPVPNKNLVSTKSK